MGSASLMQLKSYANYMFLTVEMVKRRGVGCVEGLFQLVQLKSKNAGFGGLSAHPEGGLSQFDAAEEGLQTAIDETALALQRIPNGHPPHVDWLQPAWPTLVVSNMADLPRALGSSKIAT